MIKKFKEKLKLNKVLIASLVLAVLTLIYNVIVTLINQNILTFKMIFIPAILDGFLMGFIIFSIASLFGKLRFGNNFPTYFSVAAAVFFQVFLMNLLLNVPLISLIGVGIMKALFIIIALFVVKNIK